MDDYMKEFKKNSPYLKESIEVLEDVIENLKDLYESPNNGLLTSEQHSNFMKFFRERMNYGRFLVDMCYYDSSPRE